MKRPWYFRPYIAPLLILLPGALLGEAARRITQTQTAAVIVSAGLSGLSAWLFLGAWHRYCAAHGHRRDL